MYIKNYIFNTILLHFMVIMVNRCTLVLAQNISEIRQIGGALDKFALHFLATTAEQGGESINLALSPYNIWSLMVIISEGAKGNTAAELQNALGVPPSQDRDSFRKSYHELENYLLKKDDVGVTLESTNSIFTSIDEQLKANFVNIANKFYNADLSQVDFRDTANAVNTINSHINATSRGRITNFVKENDIQNSKTFMTSILFFKGLWAEEFNRTLTTKENFYDDKGNPNGEVDMMYNEGSFPFSLIFDEKAIAVELPYKGDTMAMIVILPKKNVPLQSILNKMAESDFSDIVNTLDESIEVFGDEPVKIYLPKFKIISDLNLNSVLSQMGIKDIFSEDNANFSEMFANNSLYISRIIQRAEIKVDEQGTEAAAASGASFQYRSPAPKFMANKPFAFVIYNKVTRGIVFAGKISNPKLFTN